MEHIQPKKHYPHLEGRWDNFLLACVNCNSTKGDTDVLLHDVLLPDRDNTFAAFRYTLDGKVKLEERLLPAQRTLAKATRRLTGLNTLLRQVLDANGRLIAMDRVADRMEVRGIAEDALHDLAALDAEPHRRTIAQSARGHGFFSIWMDVFAGDPDMLHRLIEAFPGTARDCFDPATGRPVTPRPAVAGLAQSGKA